MSVLFYRSVLDIYSVKMIQYECIGLHSGFIKEAPVSERESELLLCFVVVLRPR